MLLSVINYLKREEEKEEERKKDVWNKTRKVDERESRRRSDR